MTRAMRTAAKAGVSGVLVVAAIGLLLAGFVITQRPMAMADPEPTPPTRIEVATALSRVGISPLTLAAAGVSEENVALIVADVGAYLNDHDGCPAIEDAAFGTARANRDRLRALARAGTATTQDLEAVTSAEATLSSAEAALVARLEAIWDLAALRLTTEQATLIARLEAVPAGFRGASIPIELGAAERSDAQWMALREALAAERLATQDGVALEQSLASLLSAARAESAVATAALNITGMLAEIETEWDEALGAFD